MPLVLNQGLHPGSNPMSLLSPSTSLDSTEPGLTTNKKRFNPAELEIEKILVEQMVTSLTRNPGFTSALATIISNKILDYDLINENQ